MASELDRADERRSSPDWLAAQWDAHDAQLLELDERSRFATTGGGTQLRLGRPAGSYDRERHHLLGLLARSPVFAVETMPEGEVCDFREAAALLPEAERDIAATAAALTQWHRAEPRCPRCGEPTSVIRGGFARHCDTCGHDHFPRTDPAVIVAVLDVEDRLLLGRQPTWPPGRVSILAGFVETGESLEQAVHREIAEEVGVALSALRYYGSQPWPLPRSLMLGFSARASSTQVSVDGEEIAFADWFTPDEVRRQVEAGELGLPGPSSIAHRMIHSWLDGELTA